MDMIKKPIITITFLGRIEDTYYEVTLVYDRSVDKKTFNLFKNKVKNKMKDAGVLSDEILMIVWEKKLFMGFEKFSYQLLKGWV